MAQKKGRDTLSPQAHHVHSKISKETGQLDSKGLAVHVPFSFISLTTLTEGTWASEDLLLPSRHSEHSERGDPSDSELLHERSIDKWQLNATRRTPQSSRKREIISLDQFCPTTSRAIFPTLCSHYSKEGASSLPAHSTSSLPHTGLFWATVPPRVSYIKRRVTVRPKGIFLSHHVQTNQSTCIHCVG